MGRLIAAVAVSLLTVLIGVLGAPVLLATAGIAEWEVYTPGGNLISHNDIWKDEHGTCLRSDAKPDAVDATVHVSHVTGWRYYPGHIVGSSTEGHFIFKETTGELWRFAEPTELERAKKSRHLGRPLSPWLTPTDGWQEAWLPFFVWRPCRDNSAPATLTEAECNAALDPTKLALYKTTTWGRICDQWKQKGRLDNLDPEMTFLEDFCAEINAAGD